MQQKAFPEYGSDYTFSQFEEKILAYWKNSKVFERQLEASRSKKPFYFYDGPPFATGLPHYGHILTGTIKDIVPRYWSMRGYHVPRRFGWDTHGLPVEFEMEKTLNLSGSLAIMDYGVGKFNEACRGIVLRYTSEWRETVERMGRWIDMENDYKTMDPDFMESVWWVFKELWKKGLIYEGKKVVPYSWRLTAPLSNFEASLNYKDVQDPAITVLLELTSLPSSPKAGREAEWVGNTAFAVWTTTPWTLPSNLAVAVNTVAEKFKYGRYKLDKAFGKITHVIMGEALAERYGLNEPTASFSGAELIDATYRPLFKVFDDEERKRQRAFRALDGSDFVTATDGTGIVHMAPGFGEDDFFTCQKNGISVADPTDMQAAFTKEVLRDERLRDIVGLFVKDADKILIKSLKDANLLLKQDTLQHAYPFCERSDTPLIYKAISSWFVNVEAIKEQMLANNQKIHWVPAHIKDGRFGKWLENARDWCISRNRFWGTPIPVWRCGSCEHRECVGSRAELDALLGRRLEDLHMHYVDEVRVACPRCGSRSEFRRTPEVLDCWFESGSMPYAQEHYPFENKEKLDKSFPADFIAEGLDQTRGWFYTLTVLSAALFGKPAFRNCIVNGMVLAEDGRKMSKRLKNYPDPKEILAKYGADALRLYLMQSPAMHGEELRFSEKGLLELMRAVMLPLWNSYSFFASYANIDGWSASRLAEAPAPEDRSLLDRWILARAKQAESKIHAAMAKYEISLAAPILIDLIEDLTNWYIRLNRERYWSDAKAGFSPDKLAAYATLWQTLHRLSLLLAPGLPFIAETLMAALRGVSVHEIAESGDLMSVHEHGLSDPESLALSDAEKQVLLQVSLAQKMILLGRSLRGEAKMGLRQPLPKLRVAGLSPEEVHELEAVRALVLKEVNVKEVEIVAKASDLVEESAKPNHKALGKRVGPKMKEIQATLASWGHAEIQQLENSGSATVAGILLSQADVQIVRKAKEGRLAQAGYGLVAELDVALTAELEREGLAREVIHSIQQARKESKFHLADRIQVTWAAAAGSPLEILLQNEEGASGLISQETLATRFTRGEGPFEFRENFGAAGELSFRLQR